MPVKKMESHRFKILLILRWLAHVNSAASRKELSCIQRGLGGDLAQRRKRIPVDYHNQDVNAMGRSRGFLNTVEVDCSFGVAPYPFQFILYPQF